MIVFDLSKSPFEFRLQTIKSLIRLIFSSPFLSIQTPHPLKTGTTIIFSRCLAVYLSYNIVSISSIQFSSILLSPLKEVMCFHRHSCANTMETCWTMLDSEVMASPTSAFSACRISLLISCVLFQPFYRCCNLVWFLFHNRP